MTAQVEITELATIRSARYSSEALFVLSCAGGVMEILEVIFQSLRSSSSVALPTWWARLKNHALFENFLSPQEVGLRPYAQVRVSRRLAANAF
jgi:hypothetical protein